MVDASYMEAKPPRPSALKRFIDQTAMPVAIDLAGSVEAGLERVAIAVRQRPMVAMGSGVLVGLLTMQMGLRALARRR